MPMPMPMHMPLSPCPQSNPIQSTYRAHEKIHPRPSRSYPARRQPIAGREKMRL
ncbi:predicted protein [Plenodomus lingam JN3]|uniref:Predicted protein n=1 Tax=Leptosphaeria maculans (strain JN3 / isolate v23.1.3 / race Av1-4-5-6-7-8) TaxID=985895 RepID=E4ZVI9_LEPMJ|nr:predicted protein [Plenodomus lingam JN3]CBX95615.1 predicted protein [Plenodomus lingam JN3]